MASMSWIEGRFGLGARSDSPATEGDPRGWCENQIARFNPRVAGIPARRDVAVELADYLQERAMARRAAVASGGSVTPTAASSVEATNSMAAMAQPVKPARDPQVQAAARAGRATYVSLVGARVNSALNTATPFAERLAHFWANHFAVSAGRQTTVGFAGLLEFEAIRPHVMGRFGDMLLAVEQHPAMLFYLDQATSIGPNSVAAQRPFQRGKRGLNENLAREILELHTLGARTGYSQGDVTEFARALTGWTVAGIGRGPASRFMTGEPGDFAFVAELHEPGDRTILGKTYRAEGERQGEAILADLAVHPATARHIATKLARHFGADDPPSAMVARLERAFLGSGGDLPTVYRALIASPEAYIPGNAKFRSPWDWSVASLRAIGLRNMDGLATANLLNQFGQPVWRPDSPAGFDDVAAAWAGPDALVRRVEAAQRLAQRAGPAADARTLAPRLLGTFLTPATATAISRAESPGTGLALMLVAPEFLRR